MDEEELKEFVYDEEEESEEATDMDYEFDAARFHDFTRAETDSDSDAAEAERWFDSAGNYPPSPFIIKLNWRQGFRIGVVNTFAKSRANNNRGLNDNHNTQEISQAKPKSTVTRTSTLMKPTASHLAKQNLLVHSIRLQKKSSNVDDNSQNSSVTDDLSTTKRQKLEAGYSTREPQLKQKAFLLHKLPKKVRLDGVAANVRPHKATTIPREPDLETAHRAERRRYYKVNADQSSEQAKPIAYNKDRLHEKIVKAPCFRHQPSSFQETKQMPHCNLSQNGNTEGKSSLLRLNSVNGSRQKTRKTTNNFEALSSNKKKLSKDGNFCISRNIKQGTTVTRVFSTDKRFQDEPPINLFSKLCLASESPRNTRPLRVEGMRVKNQENKEESRKDRRDITVSRGV